MIIKLLKFLFSKLIGDIPEEKRRELWLNFNDLLKEAAKAAAEGAVKGISQQK